MRFNKCNINFETLLLQTGDSRQNIYSINKYNESPNNKINTRRQETEYRSETLG
jgi:hypothetical protein